MWKTRVTGNGVTAEARMRPGPVTCAESPAESGWWSCQKFKVIGHESAWAKDPLTAAKEPAPILPIAHIFTTSEV
jgi:hypothetical protein